MPNFTRIAANHEIPAWIAPFHGGKGALSLPGTWRPGVFGLEYQIAIGDVTSDLWKLLLEYRMLGPISKCDPVFREPAREQTAEKVMTYVKLVTDGRRKHLVLAEELAADGATTLCGGTITRVQGWKRLTRLEGDECERCAARAFAFTARPHAPAPEHAAVCV
jgi:hypothetical protein